MLAQFQSLYPNGSLTSELVQIFQGKYIVRASVHIEGVTRATGMAAAETVEAAEDEARIRALTVLGITDAPLSSVSASASASATMLPPPEATMLPPPEAIASPVQQVQIHPTPSEPTYNPIKNEDFSSKNWSITSNHDDSKDVLNSLSAKTEAPKTSKNNTPNPDFNPSLPTTYQESEFEPPIEDLPLLSPKQPELPPIPEVNNNVTPFTPRSYTPQENVTSISGGTGKKKKKAEPVDLSDVIAKTDVELQRLGWTPEQGREYLIKTYGKRGRTLLTEDELHSFLKYLESQPDPIAGF